MYILTLYNAGTEEIVSAQVFNCEKNAKTAMEMQYKREYDDCLNSGYDEDELDNTSSIGEYYATLGWGYLEEPYKWDITMAEVED